MTQCFLFANCLNRLSGVSSIHRLVAWVANETCDFAVDLSEFLSSIMLTFLLQCHLVFFPFSDIQPYKPRYSGVISPSWLPIEFCQSGGGEVNEPIESWKLLIQSLKLELLSE